MQHKMAEQKKYKAESKKDWGVTTNDQLSMQELQFGAILRIADAVEKIALDKISLEANLKFYKDLANKRLEEIDSLKRARDSYKGKFNRLKRLADGKKDDGFDHAIS